MVGDGEKIVGIVEQKAAICAFLFAQHLIDLLQDLVDRSPSSYANLSHDLKRLRDARHQPPAPNKTRAQLTPEVTYSLRILSLGRETVERDGVPVVTSEWSANSAQELFLYLLFEGPQTLETTALFEGKPTD